MIVVDCFRATVVLWFTGLRRVAADAKDRGAANIRDARDQSTSPGQRQGITRRRILCRAGGTTAATCRRKMEYDKSGYDGLVPGWFFQSAILCVPALRRGLSSTRESGFRNSAARREPRRPSGAVDCHPGGAGETEGRDGLKSPCRKAAAPGDLQCYWGYSHRSCCSGDFEEVHRRRGMRPATRSAPP
jgi:hypothetical protein